MALLNDTTIKGKLEVDNLLFKNGSKVFLKADFIELFYPIGAIYITTNNDFDPNVFFGVGNWQEISENRFLYTTNQTSGVKGGSANAIIPAHTHTIKDSGHNHTLTIGTHTHTVTNKGSHSHSITDKEHSHNIASHSHSITDKKHSHGPALSVIDWTSTIGGRYGCAYAIGGTSISSHSSNLSISSTEKIYTAKATSNLTVNAKSFNPSVSTNKSNVLLSSSQTKISMGTTGEQNLEGRNMPPYVTVHMWRRIG